MASQSDDRTVRVWRTKDWGCEQVITEPFEDCGGTTHVLRLSWSPDGLYLVSAHAMNGGESFYSKTILYGNQVFVLLFCCDIFG